ncbi:MAG: glutathione S-transferase family protein [Gammaproteobacteria bacterium]|nr:glutathione S-transferase family protein [Gammaproteobacteria bacterium]
MKLYGTPISPFVRKVRVALALKGLEYESEGTYPGTRTPEYLAISPLGKIPAFEDGDLAICDSNVIVEYLEEQYPEISIRPSNVADRARSRWLEEYAGSMLYTPLAAKIFMERLTRPYQNKVPGDERVVEDSIKNLVPPVFDYVESQLPAEGFIFGEMGIADIAVATTIINATYTDFEVDAGCWPKVSAHLKLIMAHPAVVEVMRAEEPLIAALNNARNELMAQVA